MQLPIQEALEESLNRLQRREESRDTIVASYPGLRRQLKVFLRLADELERDLPVLTPSLDFQKTSREALVRAARAKNLRHERLDQVRTLLRDVRGHLRDRVQGLGQLEKRLAHRPRLTAVVAAILVFSGGMTMATANSLPGSPFYPIKVSLEQAQVALTLTSQAKAELQLSLARKRLAEAERLLSQGDEKTLENSIDAAGRHLNLAEEAAERLDGSRKASLLRKISDFTDQQRAILSRMLAKAPADSKPTISKALAKDSEKPTKAAVPSEDLASDKTATSQNAETSTTAMVKTAPVVTPPKIAEFVVNPSVFSPNGNQIKDFTTIVVRGEKQQTLSVEIHQSGQEKVMALLRLTSDKTSPDRYATTWDGRNTAAAVLPDGIYQLRVKNEAGGYATLSANAVIDNTAPAAPLPISPASGSVVETPVLTFAWKTNDGAEIFVLQYSQDKAFSNDSTVTVTDIAIPFYPLASSGALAEGAWHWRVRAIDSSGNAGAFSSSQKFTISSAITIQGAADDAEEGLPGNSEQKSGLDAADEDRD